MKTQHHRLLLLSLLAAGAPTLGACGALPLDLRDILPDDASISLRVPGAQLPGNTGGFNLFRPLVGASSEYHANAASISSVVNTNVLDLVRRIRGIAEYPPNSTQGNTYVWGPYSPGGLDTLNYRFTATKTGTSRYTIRLDARPGSDSSPDAFKNLLDGEVEGILGASDADKGSGKGKGTFKYSNGNVYEGNFKDATLDGQGTFTYADGEFKGGKYIGQFKNNKANGKGVFNYASGDKYDGGWEDNTLSGYGVFTYANGKVVKGQFKNNKYVGP